MKEKIKSPVKLCAVCAWREFCNKKFTIQQEPGSFRCPDFVYDISLKKASETEKEVPKKKDETKD